MSERDEELEKLLAETVEPVRESGKPSDPLESLLWEVTEQERVAKELKAKKAAISKISSREEREKAIAEYRRLAELRIWRAVANVALFHTQHCGSCARDHAFFQGWYTEHRHKTDQHARKLTAGKSPGVLPERIELSFKGVVDMCIDCAGVHIAVDRFLSSQQPPKDDDPLALAA